MGGAVIRPHHAFKTCKYIEINRFITFTTGVIKCNQLWRVRIVRIIRIVYVIRIVRIIRIIYVIRIICIVAFRIRANITTQQ